ncbi:glutamine synthetase [Trichoderma parareesei]|uniref:Glutamine synthetase n=1 Tax=Trichoderma parareesei TaxID=858221 RepID=A0A2H3A5M4_TRIPA|nr:glutamine synthetase [Trichoderma parareesei]
MDETPDHGGLHYIDLIKTNLQFVHGRDCLFEVLSHLKAPNNWQVNVLKSDIITPRTIVLSDGGPSFIEVLAKLHRRSAEALATFLGEDNAADDTSAWVKRKKMEASAYQPQEQQPQKKKKNELPKKEVERSRNGVEKPPSVDGDEAKAATTSSSSLSTGNLHLMEEEEEEASLPLANKTRRGDNAAAASPYRFRGWRTPSPPREEDFEPVSRYEDSSLRPRGFICPNYGPASAFYRVPEGRSEAFNYWPNPMPVKPLEQKAAAEEVGKRPEAGGSVSSSRVPAAAAAAAAAASVSTATALAQSPPLSPEEQGKQQVNVLLYIAWPLYGCSAIVADQCELSVRELQGRVRHMLCSNGAALFGDALVGAEPSVVIGPDEAASFVVQIKGLRVNGQVVMLGPAFGDDLGGVVKGKKVEGAIRVEVELLWKGRNLRAGAAK